MPPRRQFLGESNKGLYIAARANPNNCNAHELLPFLQIVTAICISAIKPFLLSTYSANHWVLLATYAGSTIEKIRTIGIILMLTILSSPGG